MVNDTVELLKLVSPHFLGPLRACEMAYGMSVESVDVRDAREDFLLGASKTDVGAARVGERASAL